MRTSIYTEWRLPLRDGLELDVLGRLLAHISTHETGHSHPGYDYAEPGEWCGSCRWTEIRIIEVADHYGVFAASDTSTERFNAEPTHRNGKYLAHTAGPSIVPGEYTALKERWAADATALIDELRIRNRATGQKELRMPQKRALAAAAQVDEDIAAALKMWKL